MSNLTPSRSAANTSHRQTFWSPCIILLARMLELTLLSFVDAWVGISASTSTIGVIAVSLELILFTALADTLFDSRTLTNNPPLPLFDNLVPSVRSPFVNNLHTLINISVTARLSSPCSISEFCFPGYQVIDKSILQHVNFLALPPGEVHLPFSLTTHSTKFLSSS
jgi:hypothetical protein